MSNNLPDQNSYRVGGNVLRLELGDTHFQSISEKQIARIEDTVGGMQSQSHQRQIDVSERPTLPTAKQSKVPDCLTVVAQALSKAFEEQSKGTIDQMKNFAHLQQLDQTMAHSVLKSTQIAMAKRLKAVKIQEQIAEYSKKMGKSEGILGNITLALGIALMVVVIVATAVSAIADGGISLAAIPEEIAAFAGELAGGGAELAGEEIEMNVFPALADLGEMGGEEMGEEIGEEVGEAVNSESIEQLDQIEDEVTEGIVEDSAAKTRLLQFGKIFKNMAISFVFSSPMLMKYIQGKKTAEMLEKAADAQTEAGASIAVMQENNMYFKMFQQILQRAGRVIQEQGSNASEIIETFTSVTSTYQQITQGLANAV